MSAPSSFPLTGHLMAVFDTLETRGIAARALVQPLTEAAVALCQQQALPYDQASIEAAVADHVKDLSQTSAGEPKPYSPKSAGWRRPQCMAERTQRLGENSRWLQFCRRRAAYFAFPKNGLLGFLAAIPVSLLLSPFFGASVVVFFPFFFGFISFLCVDEIAKRYVRKRCGGLNEYVPTKYEMSRWATFSEIRERIQQCLASDVPLLMASDVTEFKNITDAHDQAELETQQAKDRVEAEIQADEARRQLHQMFGRST